MNFDRVKAALKKRGYAVSSFETAKDAADYLDQQIDDAPPLGMSTSTY